MKLIGEKHEGIDFLEEKDYFQHYFEYDIKEADFFLKVNYHWFTMAKDVYWYTLGIGAHTVRLPSVVYIMLVDVHTTMIDWVRVDELPGRDMSTALYYSDLYPDQFSVEDIRVINVDSMPSEVTLPSTKNILPVAVGPNRMIMVAEKDLYVRSKKMNFSCLY